MGFFSLPNSETGRGERPLSLPNSETGGGERLHFLPNSETGITRRKEASFLPKNVKCVHGTVAYGTTNSETGR